MEKPRDGQIERARMSSPLAAERLSIVSEGSSSTVDPSVDTSSPLRRHFSEVPHAPTHDEVEVLLAARVGDDVAVRARNSQLCREVPGERRTASSGRQKMMHPGPVKSQGIRG